MDGSKLALNGVVAPFQFDAFSAFAATAVVATVLLMAAMTREMVSWRAVVRRRAAERERSERMRAELWRPVWNGDAAVRHERERRRRGTSVMCAIDASRPVPHAFDLAVSLSRRLGAKLIVTHAVSGEWPFGPRAAGRAAAVSTLRKLAEARNVRIRIRRQQGDAVSVMLQHARAHDPALIVLGAHQPAGWKRLLFGSVADRVADAASRPVVLVPRMAAPVPETVRRVVCAVDLSAASGDALAQAARVAGVWGAGLTVFHAVRDSSQARQARQRIEAIAGDLEIDAGVHVAVTEGSVADAIVRAAVDEHADFIVAGPSRRTRLRRRLFGSTAIEVSRSAPCPVMLIPAAPATQRFPGSNAARRRYAA